MRSYSSLWIQKDGNEFIMSIQRWVVIMCLMTVHCREFGLGGFYGTLPTQTIL